MNDQKRQTRAVSLTIVRVSVVAIGVVVGLVAIALLTAGPTGGSINDQLDGHVDRAEALLAKGEVEKALQELYRATEVRPSYYPAMYLQAWIRASWPDKECRDGQEAVRAASLTIAGIKF